MSYVVWQASQDWQTLNDENNLTATLRLLRILAKYGYDLQPVLGYFSSLPRVLLERLCWQVLSEGLRTTPVQPWEAIVPQLFSRIGSVSPFVQQHVCELLCRVGLVGPVFNNPLGTNPLILVGPSIRHTVCSTLLWLGRLARLAKRKWPTNRSGAHYASIRVRLGLVVDQ